MPIHGYLGGVISATAPSVTTAGASGIFTLEEQLQAAGQNNWPGYQISRSVRLRSSASASLTRTNASGGSTQIITFSFWVKRGKISSGQYLTTASQSSVANDYIRFESDDTFSVCLNNASTAPTITSSAVYRDPSAWYHIVVGIDTTQATDTNRMKAYVNGVQITSFSSATYPAQNFNMRGFNSSSILQYIGAFRTGADYFDGYITEAYFIDGQQLTPSSFGVVDASTGVWNPKKYTGTYGTTGWYLNFKDPTSTTTIGYDYSGNSNNWTANNISVTAGTTYDSMVDVPIGYGGDTGVGGELRGNYCTFNPLAKGPNFPAPTNGNLQTGDTSAGNYHQSIGSTAAVSSGKWYWEIALNGATYNSRSIGIAFASELATVGDNAMWSSASALKNYRAIELLTSTTVRPCESIAGTITTASTITLPSTLTGSSVFMVAMDIGAGAIWFGLDGTWLKGATTAEIIAGTTTNAVYTDISAPTQPWTPAVYNYLNASSGYGWIGKFGQTAFSYTAPSGYKALCTQNLTAPSIVNGANYMAASLYTGTGSSQTVSNAVNSISFQPDLVWIKSRSAATDNKLTDSVRGATIALVSNSTAAETTDSTGLTAFGSSGFTVGASTTYNNSGATYVGWQWKGGGTAISNTAGSITSSVSANTTAGFSVVGYTGSGSNATVGHGLGVTPSMVITHRRASADGWVTYHTSLTSGAYILSLQSTNAQSSNATVYNSMTTLNSTVYSVGTDTSTNTSSATYIAYCFAAISGYSAFGSYTGNGSTDGPFVYTGMRPRWLMVKPYSGGTGEWPLIDSSRGAYNVASPELYASLTQADTSSNMFDLLSNGFKSRSTNANCNASGVLYIYAAFAENPFNISRAR